MKRTDIYLTRHRQADTQPVRQTGRQTVRHPGSQTDRQTDRQTPRQADRQSDTQAVRQTGSQTDRQTDRQADRQTDGHTSLEALLSVCLEELEEKRDLNFENLDGLVTLLGSLLNYRGRRKGGREREER